MSSNVMRLRCCGGQTLGLTVGIRLVEAVDAIGWKSGFYERLNDGLVSMDASRSRSITA